MTTEWKNFCISESIYHHISTSNGHPPSPFGFSSIRLRLLNRALWIISLVCYKTSVYFVFKCVHLCVCAFACSFRCVCCCVCLAMCSALVFVCAGLYYTSTFINRICDPWQTNRQRVVHICASVLACLSSSKAVAQELVSKYCEHLPHAIIFIALH